MTGSVFDSDDLKSSPQPALAHSIYTLHISGDVAPYMWDVARTSTCGAFWSCNVAYIQAGPATMQRDRLCSTRLAASVCSLLQFRHGSSMDRLPSGVWFRRGTPNFVSRKIQTSEVGVCIIGPTRVEIYLPIGGSLI